MIGKKSFYATNEVDLVDGKLQLSWEGNYLADVELPPKPPYYAHKLPDGTPLWVPGLMPHPLA